MGCFSWLCKGCGESIKYPDDGDTSWMSDAVVLFADGFMVAGRYDGYGRLESPSGGTRWDQQEDFEEPCMWHQRCWKAADCPEYDGPSQSAPDQGLD